MVYLAGSIHCDDPSWIALLEDVNFLALILRKCEMHASRVYVFSTRKMKIASQPNGEPIHCFVFTMALSADRILVAGLAPLSGLLLLRSLVLVNVLFVSSQLFEIVAREVVE